MTDHLHVRVSNWRIAACAGCEAVLRSPFPPHPTGHDPDGFDTFTRELALELGAGHDEFSSTEVARAWARAFGWAETPDGWFCPAHGKCICGEDDATGPALPHKISCPAGERA